MAISTSTVKIRRMDPVPFVMMSILVLGTIGVLVVNGAHPVVPAGVFGELYIGGDGLARLLGGRTSRARGRCGRWRGA